MSGEITRLRRKLSHVKDTERREKLSREMKEKNKEFKKKVADEKLKLKRNMYAVSDEAAFWRTWSKSKPFEQTDLPIFEDNAEGTIDANDQLLANHFVKPSRTEYRKLNSNLNRTDIHLKHTDHSELDRLIGNLNNNKSPGLDRITNKLIKIIYTNDKQYITGMFNAMLTSNRIPKVLKQGRMIFFNKPKRKVSQPKDLRPITLIMGWCKIAERLFADRIEGRLDRLNFFNQKQFGFRKGFSTLDAISDLISNIEKGKSKFKYNLVVAIDVSGAFDGIGWDAVMKNLIKSGIENHYLIAAESLLVDRQIQINQRIYNSQRGCPQGGCASPLLWKIGMNELLNILKRKFKRLRFTAYADDLALLISSNSLGELERSLNEIWIEIGKWCKQAQLVLNVEKTEFMLLGRRKVEIKLENEPIRIIRQLKYLGLIVDKELTFRPHLEHLQSKTATIQTKINQMKWLNAEIELRFRLRLYFSVFLPMLSYAARIWYPRISHKSSYRESLTRMQRRILVSLTGIYKTTPHMITQKLFNIVDINIELKAHTMQLTPTQSRRDLKTEIRNRTLTRLPDYGYEAFRTEIELSTHRYLLWCLTNVGPFLDYLNCILPNSYPDKFCRYCAEAFETSSHLVFECRHFASLTSQSDTLESKCILVINEIYRNPH